MQKNPVSRLAIYARAIVFTLVLLAVAGSIPRSAAAATAPSATYLTFAATGHSIRTSAFVLFFQQYGGVATFGYPLAEQTMENGYLVQYFERQRFEFHPENAGSAYAVELGRLGAEQSRAEQPFATVVAFANSATRQYVAQTQHSLAEPFLSYWQAHGGVRILGYPISEPVMENGLRVQYFERARLEAHPENAAPYNVLLGQLGLTSYQQHYGPAAAVSTLTAHETRLMVDINAIRKAVGLVALTYDPKLITLARDRSADMATRHYFAHTTPDGTDFLAMLTPRKIPAVLGGEIIAENNYPTAATADQAYQGFMHSKEHHDAIMMGNWRTVGVGEATDSAGMHFFTVIFIQAP